MGCAKRTMQPVPVGTPSMAAESSCQVETKELNLHLSVPLAAATAASTVERRSMRFKVGCSRCNQI